jgi:predicted actin-binding protein
MLPWGLGGASVAVLIAAAVAVPGAARTNAAPENTDPPRILGTPEEGQVLRAQPGSWTNALTNFDYQWLRCSRTGAACSPILDATSKEYAVVSTDVGNRLRVRVTAKNADGKTNATSPASEIVKAATSNAPQRTASPTIAGTPQQGQQLTASTGNWNGAQPMTFAFQWQRCDANGDACVDIPGATAKTYVPQTTDVGKTLRVRVAAKNSSGTASATSVPTAAVRKAGVPSGSAIPIAEVSPPARLILDKFEYSPRPVRSIRETLTLRFRVSDTEDHRVQGALVYVLGTPYNRFSVPPETETGGDGWVTLQLQPTGRLADQLHRGGKFNFFVRARKPGDSLLAGVSTRRLVQINLSSPLG